MCCKVNKLNLYHKYISSIPTYSRTKLLENNKTNFLNSREYINGQSSYLSDCSYSETICCQQGPGWKWYATAHVSKTKYANHC